MTDVVVLHDLGDEAGGAPWIDALTRSGWDGRVHAPDLAGHNGTPPPVGGNYVLLDPVYAVFDLVTSLAEQPVVVGVGLSGWAAQVLGLGGRASRLVLVDGLGGPWVTPAEAIAAQTALMRAILADPAAMAPPPATGLDPRLRHRIPAHGSRRMSEHAAREMPVCVHVIETSESPVTPDDVDALLPLFSSGSSINRLPIWDRMAIAATIVDAAQPS